MNELGFVGLGVMGGRVTKRLMDAGYPVTGYNRTKSKAQWLLDSGMKWAATPQELTEKVDVVFSMVTNTEAVKAITNKLYTECRGIGVDQKDMAAVLEVLAVISGVEL